ncbi:MAG: hypothetical protein GXN98_04780 [Euryarchaeota archaeon]|nr:hypothetical protein [Euryarchaeota archaeon]
MRLRVLLLLLLAIALVPAVSATPVDVVLVRSDIPHEFAIALAYSQSTGIPVVATPPERLSQDAREMLEGYIERGYRRLVIIGGEEAVSREVQRQVDAMGYITRRIGEADRYGTAATFAREFYSSPGGAVVVSGESSSSLLAAVRLSSATGYPILYVRRSGVPPAVLEALESLRVRRVLVIEGDLTEEALKQLSRYELRVVRDGAVPERGGAGGLPSLIAAFVLGAASVLLASRLRRRRQRLPSEILSEDELRVVRVMMQEGGRVTQDMLPEMTGFSRPKVSRIVKELVERGIIEKVPRGRTHELALKKQFE